MGNIDNQMVNAISKLNIEGNIIPTTWYKFFTFDNGKPDLIAIHILSDIVYWYRPTTKRCEETGEVIGVYKKFKADLLQRSYDSFAEWLGVSKRQVKEAMDRLEKKGVIFREFRSISASIHNVLFIGINVDILATSLLHSNVPPPTSERTTPYVQTHTPLHSNVPPPTSERKTNTKITTKNTTKITTESEYTPTHESEQTHFADEKNSQEPSANKQTGKSSSAKKSTSSAKSTTAKKYLTADDLVNLTLADCKFTQKDFENYPNLGEWIFADMDYQVASDYLAMRSSKNELTLTAIKMSIKEASIAGLTLCQALEVCITSGKSGWLTFKAQWYANRQQKPTWQQNPTAFANQPNPDRKSELEALATQFADDFYQSGYPGQNVIDITPNGDYS